MLNLVKPDKNVTIHSQCHLVKNFYIINFNPINKLILGWPAQFLCFIFPFIQIYCINIFEIFVFAECYDFNVFLNF